MNNLPAEMITVVYCVQDGADVARFIKQSDFVESKRSLLGEDRSLHSVILLIITRSITLLVLTV